MQTDIAVNDTAQMAVNTMNNNPNGGHSRKEKQMSAITSRATQPRKDLSAMKRYTLALTGLLALCLAVPATFAADPAAATPASSPASGPTDRYWNLEFSDMFRKGTAPLYFYSRECDGVWKSLVGSSRDKSRDRGKTFNKSWYCGDFSGAPIRDNAMKGLVKVHMTPDPWVPSDHKSFPLVLEVDAKIEGKQMTGTWKLVSADSRGIAPDLIGKGGTIKGDVTSGESPVLPPSFTLRCNMQGALVGGDPAVGNRCLVVLLGVDGGNLVSTVVGALDVGGRTYGGVIEAQAFQTEGNSLSVHPDLIQGRVSVPAKTVDAQDCLYVFDFQGTMFATLVVGTYTVTAKVSGQPDLTVAGSFDGSIDKGLPQAPPPRKPIHADLKNFVPVQPGEHPRLLFRKADVPALRKKAETPEGKAIIGRLRHALGGNGETFPEKVSPATKGYPEGGYKVLGIGEPGYLTISHAAGYGLLYQLTGDKKYADLGRRAFERYMEGVRDVDSRYSFVAPNGELRAGSSWAVAALGYDLCYDGWDPEFRAKVAKAFLTVRIEDGDAGLIRCATAPKYGPTKNHYGGIAAAGMAVMAIMNDPGTEGTNFDALVPAMTQATTRLLTGGFGDYGFYAEGHGPSHVSSDTGYLPMLQAWRHALGKDFITPAPNAQWISLRWVMETVPINGRPMYLNRQKAQGSYGDDNFWRGGWSHGGQFAQGFGTVEPKYVPAMLWTYQQVIEPAEIAGLFRHAWLKLGERSYDSLRQPWHAVVSFVNWPVGVTPANPATVLPHAIFDSNKGYTVFRNRWQDGDDIVITSLLGYGPADGYTPGGGPILAFAYGQKLALGSLAGKAGKFTPSPAGGVTVADDGAGILAFDASGASGADALLVAVGAGLKGGANATLHQVSAGGTEVQILAFAKGRAVPAPTVEGAVITIGGQKITVDKDGLTFAVTTKPPVPAVGKAPVLPRN